MSISIKQCLTMGFGVMAAFVALVGAVGMALPLPGILIGIVLASILACALMTWLIMRKISAGLNDALRITQLVAQGDLTVKVSAEGADEIAFLKQALGEMVRNLRAIVGKVRADSDLLSVAALQLNSSAAHVTEGAREQNEAAGSVAAAVEKASAGIASVAQSAQTVRELSQQSLASVRRSADGLGELASRLADLQNAVGAISVSVRGFVASTRTITAMASQVKALAEQTNLLALNAAIEAARAGDQGRGFAMVADEVRKLAEKSVEAAKEIENITGVLGQKTGAVETALATGATSIASSRQRMTDVQQALDEALDLVGRATDGIDGISAATREQSALSSNIAGNVERISQAAGTNCAASAQTLAAAGQIEGTASNLRSAVTRFKLDRG